MSEPVVDLWGNVVSPFVNAKERYGIWPTTVWSCDLSDAFTQELKRAIGDDGEARSECFRRKANDRSVYAGKVIIRGGTVYPAIKRLTRSTNYVAVCSCRWMSKAQDTREAAEREGAAHSDGSSDG